MTLLALLRRSLLTGALLLASHGLTNAWVQEPAIPPLTGHVIDQTGTFSAQQAAALEQRLAALEARKGSQLVVFMVASTAPQDIAQYALRAAEQWKLGRKQVDDGAILLIAKADRAVRLEVGYGLEGTLNDATAKRIIEETLLPRFRQQDYVGGINAGVQRIIQVMDGEALPPPTGKVRDDDLDLRQFTPLLLLGAWLIGSFLRGAFGRILGSVATGGAIGLLAWWMVGTLWMAVFAGTMAMLLSLIGVGGASRTIGYYSGLGGGRGGWGSGGFSGGGGGFGGGGASGKW